MSRGAARWYFCAVPLLLTGCHGGQSALDPAGPQSGRIYSLWWLLFGVCAVVFLLVIAFAVYAAIRAGQRRDSAPGEIEQQPKVTRVIAGATVITTVILFVFLIASVWTSRASSSVPPPKDALEVDIIGHQWWWEAQYADPSPSQRVLTANEIHIPVGKPVVIRTSTRDVIHSFWVPNLLGKIDAIPDHVNTVWLQADRPGVFRGQCAEFCGAQHAHMSFQVIAEPLDQFNSWLDQQRRPAVEPSTPAQQRGHDVFLSQPCVLCHSIRGTDSFGQVAPDLTHVASRSYIAAGTLPNNRGNLGGWITDSQHIKPGNHMPPIPIAPADVQPLLEYLESLK